MQFLISVTKFMGEVSWRRLHKAHRARGHVPHFTGHGGHREWVEFNAPLDTIQVISEAEGDTVSIRTVNKKLTELYWPSRKRSPKRLVEPKKVEGHDKTNFSGSSCQNFRPSNAAQYHEQFWQVGWYEIAFLSLLVWLCFPSVSVTVLCSRH